MAEGWRVNKDDLIVNLAGRILASASAGRRRDHREKPHDGYNESSDDSLHDQFSVGQEWRTEIQAWLTPDKRN